jgi:hypothetical protein
LKTQFNFLKTNGIDRVYRVDIFCAEDVEDYIQAECGIENGGLIAVGLIKPGTDIGDTDEEKVTFLQTALNWTDGIADSPQTMWRILDTRGSKAADTFTEEEGFGLSGTEVTGADEAWVFESLNVFDNRNFVAGVNKRRKWNAIFVTAARRDDGYVAHYRENVNFRGSLLIEQSTKSRQRWSWEARASHDTTPPLALVAPEEIFVSE